MADFRIQRSVISYGIVCPVEVIIYCAGKPDARNIIFFCKNLRPSGVMKASERAVLSMVPPL